MHLGIFYGSLSIFMSMFGPCLTYSFLQSMRDEIGCDSFCFGSMQSARSGLTLIGSFLVGRLSDKIGRLPVLYLGVSAILCSYAIVLTSYTVEAFWFSLLPLMLNQNSNVLRALFADYALEEASTQSDRASHLGLLGMSGESGNSSLYFFLLLSRRYCLHGWSCRWFFHVFQLPTSGP